MDDPQSNAPTVRRSPEETPTILIDGPQTPRQTLQLTPGTVLGGRYRIVSLIGRGGMGVVYRAEDLKVGQTIAAKFLSRGGTEETRLLYEEVRIGREISHPNVVRLYDIAEVDEHLFITMEFVGGEDLGSLLGRVGRLSPDKALAVARDICGGLAAAHERGVIHRDLKPGNVLIDSRGRARISDFGLAIAQEVGTRHALAGTLAYMAPEQLTGGRTSMQSDIYALGLVLYEAFTGRHTFEATTTQELVARQRNADYVRPAQIVREIDPAVERVITRCLDPVPERRPQSVEEILRELPGRDALSAAVAAGETPTPAMVSAASERGDLPLLTATILLVATLAMLAANAVLSSRTVLYATVPDLKSPDVLVEKAREILASTGQPLPQGDHHFAFYADPDERHHRETRGRPPSATSILFHYRQSPRPMKPRNLQRLVLPDDPPLNRSGMADVQLDASGRLVELLIVPPQVLPARPAERPYDWSRFLALAAIEGTPQPAQPLWAAPVDSDEKQAWTVGGTTRIEAAAYRGKPVWFAVIHPWTRPERMQESAVSATSLSASAVLVFLLIAVPIFVLLLARRNLRRGRIDRRGAFRFAVFIFVTLGAGMLLRVHHPPSFIAEWQTLSSATASVTFVAVMSWVVYVAMEPLVRRRWPRMLVGSSRLIEGRLRDPMIGRDLLIGAAAGTAIVLVWHLTALVPGAAPLQTPATPLASLRHVGFYLFFALAEAALRSIGGAPVLLAIYAMVRNLRVTFALTFLLSVLIFIDDPTGGLGVRIVYAAVAAGAAIFLVDRFGFLALASTAFCVLVLRYLPITLDPSDWYIGRSLFALSVIVAMTGYGFVTSLGGKRWVPEMAWDD